LDSQATYDGIIDGIKSVFTDDCEVGLFYFSGHGFDDENDGKIVTYDYIGNHYGIKYRDLVDEIVKSKCKNRIIIIDCCYAGKTGNYSIIGDSTILPCGTTILTACNTEKSALEIDNHGVFSNLLINALMGGASDIFGRITPGSIYAYIDSSLGDYDQRPLFKSHVSSFITLRKTKEKISVLEIRKMPNIFPNSNYKFQLDPSFEPTNYLGSEKIGSKDLKKPYFIKNHGEIFKLLQIYTANGLVKPTKEMHMFYAAMNSDTCELTMLGKYYWQLVQNKLI